MILDGYHSIVQSNRCNRILVLFFKLSSSWNRTRINLQHMAYWRRSTKWNSLVQYIFWSVFFLYWRPSANRSFQKGAINYASIKPSIDYSKDRLNDVKITEEPIKQLKQDLSSGGRLETLEFLCTESNVRDLQGLLQKYIKALVKNIGKRFKSSLPVLSAFSAFDPMLIPNRQSPAFHSHGDAEVKVLADHFFDGDDSEADEFKTEWKKMKYDLLSWKEHIPRDTGWQERHTYWVVT